MRIKYLFIPLICVVISLTALSGVLAGCYEEECSEGRDPGSCARARWAYEECKRREKAEREARKAAEREQLEEAERGALKEAVKPKEKSRYPFMDDIREINKIEQKY